MIEVNGISKQFRADTGKSFSLRDVSISLRPGAMLAILGTNGSGKSTLLKILAGQLEPDRGTIEYVAVGMRTLMLSDCQHPKRLYFDQDSGRDIVPSMRLWENVLLGYISSPVGSLRFPSKSIVRDRIKTALSTVALGLEHRMSEQARVLSGGEREGLVLARALLFGNDVYLLDEFTSSLTPELSHHYMSLVKSIMVREGKYGCFVTHEVPLAFLYADQFLFMHEGTVIMSSQENTEDVQREITALYAKCFG